MNTPLLNPQPALANPFDQPGQWYKGCLHVHTTRSDGKRTPQQVVDWYRDHGLHFAALTDHGVRSEVGTNGDGFLLLSGIEADGIDPDMGVYHLVGLGLEKAPDLERAAELPIQEAINRLRAAGGLVSFAHPYWLGQMSKDLMQLEGCFGIEVYNAGCEIEEAKGLSVVHWDDLLAGGRRISGLAVDDAHCLNGWEQAGLGWVWAKAPALEQGAILRALERGSYYASSGPQIYDFRFDGEQRRIHVRCSPSEVVDVVGNGRWSRRYWAQPGETPTEVVSHKLRRKQRYVLVACQDAQGRRAWSNPLFLDDFVVQAPSSHLISVELLGLDVGVGRRTDRRE